MFKLTTIALALAVQTINAHENHDHEQEPIAGPLNGLWYNSLPGDGGKQVRRAKLEEYETSSQIGNQEF